MLSLQPWTLFWTVFNVLVLFLAMKKFLVKPVMQVIEQREKQIQDEMDEAAATKAEANTLKKNYEEHLRVAKQEANQMIEQAKHQAKEEQKRIYDETQAESAKMISRAKKEIEDEKEQAQKELKKEIAVLAVAAARKILETGDRNDPGSNQ